MTDRLTTLACAVLAATAAAASARAAAVGACQMVKVADLPVTMVGTQPLVTAKINGKDGLFLIDTGSFYSVLAQGAVETYALKHIRRRRPSRLSASAARILPHRSPRSANSPMRASPSARSAFW